MHPYTVKNYLWLAILAMLVLIACLSGCSSAPKVQAKKPQYCYTDQKIKTVNGDTVSSETNVECSDNMAKHIVSAQAGVANQCGYHPIKDRNGNVIGQELTCLVFKNGKADGWVYGINN